MANIDLPSYKNITTPEAIAARLKYLRKLSGLTRDDLAEKADVGTASISAWENGRSAMTPRSARKIISTLRKIGVMCEERWLLIGAGEWPKWLEKQVYQSRPEGLPAYGLPVYENSEKSSPETELSQQLISKEVEAFIAANSRAVTVNIADTSLLPVLRKGDIVGGFWQPSTSIEQDGLGIVYFHQRLQVRYVRKTEVEGVFNLSFLTLDLAKTPSEPFELLNVSLAEIAPVTRMWRG